MLRLLLMVIPLVIISCVTRTSLHAPTETFCKAFVTATKEKTAKAWQSLVHPASLPYLDKSLPPPDSGSWLDYLQRINIPKGMPECEPTPIEQISRFEEGGKRYRVQDLAFVYPEVVTHNIQVTVLYNGRRKHVHNLAVHFDGTSFKLLLPSDVQLLEK